MGIRLEPAATATQPREADRPGHAPGGPQTSVTHQRPAGHGYRFIAMALIVTGALIGLALYTKSQDALVAQERQAPTWPCAGANAQGLAPHRPSHAARIRDAVANRQAPALRLRAGWPSNRAGARHPDPVGTGVERMAGSWPAIWTWMAKKPAPSISGARARPIHLEPGATPDLRKQLTRNGLFVGKPRLGEVSGKWTLQLSRPIVSQKAAR